MDLPEVTDPNQHFPIEFGGAIGRLPRVKKQPPAPSRKCASTGLTGVAEA